MLQWLVNALRRLGWLGRVFDASPIHDSSAFEDAVSSAADALSNDLARVGAKAEPERDA